jgi:hypothetical protein
MAEPPVPLVLPPPLPPSLDVAGLAPPVPFVADVVWVSFPRAHAANSVETRPTTTNARPAQRRSVLMRMKSPGEPAAGKTARVRAEKRTAKGPDPWPCFQA